MIGPGWNPTSKCSFLEPRFARTPRWNARRPGRSGCPTDRSGGGSCVDARLRRPVLRRGCREGSRHPEGSRGTAPSTPWGRCLHCVFAWYNGSMPGMFKNLIDWTSRFRPQPFDGKHGLLLSASPSMGGGNRGLWVLRMPLSTSARESTRTCSRSPRRTRRSSMAKLPTPRYALGSKRISKRFSRSRKPQSTTRASSARGSSSSESLQAQRPIGGPNADISTIDSHEQP